MKAKYKQWGIRFIITIYSEAYFLKKRECATRADWSLLNIVGAHWGSIFFIAKTSPVKFLGLKVFTMVHWGFKGLIK